MATHPAPWKRRGLLVRVNATHGWWHSHAQSPTVLALSPRLWRIYFAARNVHNLSAMLAVDVDPGDGMRVVAEHVEPLLKPGAADSFDSGGLGPSCALRINGRIHLYYSGIPVHGDREYRVAIGLAFSDDGLNFTRPFAAPILGIGPRDPYFVSTPFVAVAPGGYRVWYTSGTGWVDHGGGRDPSYSIRSAFSRDAVTWEAESNLTVSDAHDTHACFTRPWIAPDGAGQRMWYSRRGLNFRAGGDQTYRLCSRRVNADGSLGDEQAVTFANAPHHEDPDSWMQAYACVMPWREGHVMFYNGNDFGEHGICWATRGVT